MLDCKCKTICEILCLWCRWKIIVLIKSWCVVVTTIISANFSVRIAHVSLSWSSVRQQSSMEIQITFICNILFGTDLLYFYLHVWLTGNWRGCLSLITAGLYSCRKLEVDWPGLIMHGSRLWPDSRGGSGVKRGVCMSAPLSYFSPWVSRPMTRAQHPGTACYCGWGRDLQSSPALVHPHRGKLLCKHVTTSSLSLFPTQCNKHWGSCECIACVIMYKKPMCALLDSYT